MLDARHPSVSCHESEVLFVARCVFIIGVIVILHVVYVRRWIRIEADAQSAYIGAASRSRARSLRTVAKARLRTGPQVAERLGSIDGALPGLFPPYKSREVEGKQP